MDIENSDSRMEVENGPQALEGTMLVAAASPVDDGCRLQEEMVPWLRAFVRLPDSVTPETKKKHAIVERRESNASGLQDAAMALIREDALTSSSNKLHGTARQFGSPAAGRTAGSSGIFCNDDQLATSGPPLPLGLWYGLYPEILRLTRPHAPQTPSCATAEY